MENFIINSAGVTVQVGKTYYYFNTGLGEVKTHFVRYFCNNIWAVDYDGKVDIDSLRENKQDVILAP